MTRVRLRHAGGPEAMAIETGVVPVPAAGQVLLRAEAVGVAFNDVTTRSGLNPGKLPDVLGFDTVGLVLATGRGVTEFTVGQRVGALVGTGGYATHVVAAATHVAPLPHGVDAAILDALLLNYLTAHQMFHHLARPRPGSAVLVLGAAGGVGSALTQIARSAGVTVYGTSSPPRRGRVEELGATWVADATSVPVSVAATFDPVGGPSLARSRRATARDGVVVSYGFSFAAGSGRSRSRALASMLVAIARAKVTPGPKLVLHTVERAVKKDPARFRTDIAALVGQLSSGAIRPEVTTLPLTRAAEAHRLLESRQVTGKIVLLP